jgi:DNA-binding MarR family transcriptional regulator
VSHQDTSPEAVQLRRLEQAVRQLAKVVFAGNQRARLGLTGGAVDRAGYAALARLETGEMRLSDLATRLELDVSTVSRQVRLLTDIGLVRRRPDPQDGRASLISLTDTGRIELARQRDARCELLADALDGWNDADRETLLAVLERLNTSVSTAAETPRSRRLQQVHA